MNLNIETEGFSEGHDVVSLVARLRREQGSGHPLFFVLTIITSSPLWGKVCFCEIMAYVKLLSITSTN